MLMDLLISCSLTSSPMCWISWEIMTGMANSAKAAIRKGIPTIRYSLPTTLHIALIYTNQRRMLLGENTHLPHSSPSECVSYLASIVYELLSGTSRSHERFNSLTSLWGLSFGDTPYRSSNSNGFL